jgi:hypothetical protein
MILLYDIIEILYPTDRARGAMLVMLTPDRCGIGLAPIDGDRLWQTMAADGVGEEAPDGLFVAVLHEEEIDGVASLVHARSRYFHCPLTFMDVSSIRQLPPTG